MDYKEFIDKIVIERKFTARFVSISGQQHMMFGIWYLVLAITSTIQTAEVRQSEDTQRVTSLLNLMTEEIQGARKSFGESGPEYSVQGFKQRILQLLQGK